MSDMKKVGIGFGIFLASFTVMFILEWIVDPLVNTMEAIYPADLGSLIWFLILILWIVGMLVVPSYFIIGGLRTPTHNDGPTNTIAGVLIFIFGILLTYQGYFWITSFADLITDEIGIVLYWISVLCIWTLIVIITPIYLVIEGTKH